MKFLGMSTKIAVLLLIITATTVHPCFAITKIANDPTELCVGARPLGMGRAFSGLADDPSAIFINPAGLGKVKNWEISSMSGKYLNEFDYVQFSALYPTEFGTFGAGYGGSSIEFVTASSETITIGSETRISPTGEVRGKYGNTALLLSYGNCFTFGQIKKLFLGASLKFLAQELSATGINVAGSATGMEMNLGALYPLRKDLSLALALQNVLPASLGGKIRWSTNTEEILPSSIKLGCAYNLLGQKGTFSTPQELTLAVDYDYQITRSGILGALHLGLEWAPVRNINIRLGSDQRISENSSGTSASLTDNLSYGIGLLLNGFRFDYSYNAYNGIVSNATSYFSVSYGIWDKTPEPTPFVRIASPENQSIIYDGKLIINGEILDPQVKRVTIQAIEAKIKDKGNFSTTVKLNLGKNAIIIQALDKDNKLLQKSVLKILRLPSFKDIQPDYWAKLQIGQLSLLGMVTGYPNNTYQPDGPVTRAEMALLLTRLSKSKPKTAIKPPFKDVAVSHWGVSSIQSAATAKLITGYPDGTFRPSRPINRAEGVTLVSRFTQLATPRVLEAPYNDVPGRFWAVKKITAAKEAGYLDFIKTSYFYPQRNLSRGESTYLLSKISALKPEIDALMNFNTGY